MSKAKVLTFRYPRPVRLAVSALGFIPLLILEGITIGHIQFAPDGMAKVWAFIACAMIPFLITNIVFTELKIEEDKISLRRLFWTKALAWSEIEYVEHRPTLHRLNLRSQRGVLSIHKQFKEYPKLYSILRNRIPRQAFGPNIEAPTSIRSSLMRRLFLVAPLGVAIVGYGYSRIPHQAMTAYLLYAAALLMFAGASYFVLLRIELESDELRFVYPARTVNHSIKNLQEINVVQRFQEVALRLDMAGKPIEIGESQMRVSPEQLATSLAEQNGAKVRYL